MEKVQFVETLIKFPDETFMFAEGKTYSCLAQGRFVIRVQGMLLYSCVSI